MLRVLIASSVRFYADGLAIQLATRDGLEVVGVARAIDDLLASFVRCEPDVLLLDVSLPATRPAAVVAALAAARPSVRIVALAVAESDEDVVGWAETGIDGLVTRNSSLADVVAAIEGASRGEMHCSPHVAATLLRRVSTLASAQAAVAGVQPLEALTSREREILRLIDDGCSNKEIAQRLSIEVATVKNHVHHILEKLGVRRRAEAAATLRRRRHQAETQQLR